MNFYARKFDMYNTNFANSHGLSNNNNFSTASDIAILSYHVILNILFNININ